MKVRLGHALFYLMALCLFAGCGNADPVPLPDTPALSAGAEFSDIAGHPSELYILVGLQRGLYGVPSDGKFLPDVPATQGEFISTLWNLAGRPGGNGAAAWADAQNLLEGISFSEDTPITRQDAMEILFRYNGSLSGMESMLTGIYDDAFLDSDQIPAGGKPALYWGFYNVLIRETEPDKIAPSGTVSRGDMAEMMVRYMDDFQSGASDT